MRSVLDEAAVRHVALLARLEVSDEEVKRYAEQLSAVLGYVDQLNEVDTTNVPPTAHAHRISNVLREDAVRPSLDPDQALANAPQQQNGFFKVPKVLEQEST